MATHRKTAARRPKTAATKRAHPAKPGAARSVKSAPKSSAAAGARTPARPAAPAKMKPAAAAKAASNSAGKAAASKKAMKPRLAVAKRTPAVEVRPLGVLPPESRAKGSDRAPAATITAGRPRPTAARTAEPSRTPGAQRLTDKDINEFEQRLLAERARIMKEMGHLENTVLKVNQRDSSGDLSGYSFHMADAGTDAMEREKAFLFASAEGRALMEINEALRRLYNGTYGICEVCGEPIGRARLEAVPYARLCVRDKEKEERANRSTP